MAGGQHDDTAPTSPVWRPWRTIAMFTGCASLVGIGYGLLVTDGLLYAGVRGAVIGALIGASTALFETYVAKGWLRPWFARQRFVVTLIVRTVVYFALVMGALVFGLFGFPGPKPTVATFWAELERDVMFSLAVVLTFNFINAMRQLIGGDILASFFTGRYHRPVREERVFLFIDLVGSTGLTHRLGDARYHALLNRFYQDVGRAVLAHGGEIHRYVGDEMMVSWPVERGLAKARCLRALMAADAALRAGAARYRAEFDTVPTFRAGLHVGPVTTGELGFERKEIGFVGEAVNIAARVEQSARALDRPYMASAAVIDRLRATDGLPPGLEVEAMGERALRGVVPPVDLVALSVARA